MSWEIRDDSDGRNRLLMPAGTVCLYIAGIDGRNTFRVALRRVACWDVLSDWDGFMVGSGAVELIIESLVNSDVVFTEIHNENGAFTSDGAEKL